MPMQRRDLYHALIARSVTSSRSEPAVQRRNSNVRESSAYPLKLCVNADTPVPQPSAKDRDRGEPRGSAPPTPPGIRVRTAAVREVGLTSSEQGGESERSEVCFRKPQ